MNVTARPIIFSNIQLEKSDVETEHAFDEKRFGEIVDRVVIEKSGITIHLKE